jgi:stearoyl-CoA desaturase (delta-9 desaturase)
MIYDLLNLISGVVDMPWWGYVIVTLVFTHITIAAITIYLHRHSAHRALELHAIPSHFFRLWLWLTTGMVQNNGLQYIASIMRNVKQKMTHIVRLF